MPGDTAVVSGRQPVEYIEETTFATGEVDGVYSWIGAVTSFSVSQGVESSRVQFLPEDSESNKLEVHQNIKVSEMYEVDITFHPQDFSFLQYFTGADGSLSDSLTSIQFGEQNEDSGEYRRILGAVGEEFSMSVTEDDVVEIDASFIAADAEDWTTTDYVGTGSHAAEDTSSPLVYQDLSNIQYKAAAFEGLVTDLTLTVSNDLEVTKDLSVNRNSKVGAITPVSREVTVELDVTYDNMDFAQTVRNYNAGDFTFTLGPADESWTVEGVKWPEFPYEFTPEDLVGDSVTSDPATGLTWV